MRKALGLWLIIMIFGMTVSTGMSSNYVVAVTTGDPYEAFWDILNKEAELVVGVENGNLSLVSDLIQNSRLGAENAANISALIWQALEELEASGIKTYYTAEELQEMAQNISENGLPQETVDALKEQGWTDEQIQALEEYIVQNGANITEDFNMTAFLKDFSVAFVEVGFKYNHYEAWALEKWKWSQPAEAPTANNGELINPVLADSWAQFYHAYAVSDYVRMEEFIKSLRDSTYNFLTYQKRFVSLTFLCNRSVITKTGTLDHVNWSDNGSMVFTTLVTSPTDGGFILNTTTYYWPSALQAYELISNIMTLVKARNYGNNNSEVQWILNQKVSELRNALKVIIVSTGTSTVYVSDEPVYPIEPIDPIYPIEPELPVLLVSTTSPEESSTPELSESTTSITPADEITLLALDPNNEEGRLVVDSVDVEVVEVTLDYVTYKVVVYLHVEDNAVSNVNAEFQGTELSDSQYVGFLYPDDSLVVESTVSGKVYGSGQVTVSGTVKITYTPSSGPTPNSVELASEEREITKSYSKTITLEDDVDPSKIYVSIATYDENGDGTVTADEDVTFKVVVRNENSNADVSGVCWINVVYPISSNERGNRTFSVSVNAPAGGSDVETFGSVHYAWSGTFMYTGKCSLDQYTKSFDGYVTVVTDTSPMNPSNSLFSVELIAYPTELEGGGEVYLQVKAWNYDGSLIPVMGYIEIDGDRRSIDAKIPADESGDSLLTFTYNVIGVGNHTFKLFLDNQDGEPNGIGEEHWSEVTVEVKTGDQLKQVTSECDPLYFKYNMGNYEATLTCRLTIYNGYDYDLKVTGDIVSDIDVSILNKYLQLQAGSSSPVVSYIDPTTIPTGGYSTITSIAHFKISKPDILVIGDIFPYWEDAWNDIQVEGIYGAMVPVEIIHDVPFDKLGIQRFTLQSSVYIEVDHIAVVADLATDAYLTYKLGSKVMPVANIKFIKDALTRLPPEVREKINPIIEQISINWLANWIKERAITWWRG
ncbi:hypothetical protein [Thermococcus sp. GR6]|uniref:hypothetical protein n=1 Tax=Thermococcus sp. GR6 TaxID=1638256 RepID=UPI00197CC4E1|nr:hypothetical protein [Thermococcus sp. GR6]